MKRKISKDNSPVSRRKLLTGITTFAGVTTAGCNDSDDGTKREIASDSASQSNATPNEFEEIKSDIEDVFEIISTVPVVANENFVFDLKMFKDNLEGEELQEVLKEVEFRTQQLDPGIANRAEQESLLIAIEVAKLLVRQRLLVHQVIAAGLAYERRFRDLEYKKANEAIHDARYYLDELTTNGEQIEERLNRTSELEISLDGYEPGTFRATQIVLVEVALWTTPAYEGLHHAIKGFSSFEDGNMAIEENLFKSAAEEYEASKVSFEKADEALNKALNHDREIPQIKPLVSGMKCIMPVYVEASASLQRSAKEFRKGNKQRGKEIFKNALEPTERKMTRCL